MKHEEQCFSYFQTRRSGLKKRGAAKFFQVYQLFSLGVWKSDETLFLMFDIAS